MQAQDLVRHLTELHGIPPRSAIQRASDALWQVGLGEERLRPVGTMSTGQRQRVKLASAIAHDPALVLLDEPTDGLDPVQRDDMLALIRRIGTEFGIDIVVSSHHLEEVERICDAVVILDAGRMIRSGTLSELRQGDAGLLVEVDGGHEELVERLRAAGLEAEVAGETILVSGEDPHDIVRDAVADLGLGLRRLEPRSRTLEDVYLEASA